MTREKRLKLLEEYVKGINEDMADLPKNEHRFWIEAEPDERGYGVMFTVNDRLNGDYLTFMIRWFPLRTKHGYLFPMDIIDRINTFIMNRKEF